VVVGGEEKKKSAMSLEEKGGGGSPSFAGEEKRTPFEELRRKAIEEERRKSFLEDEARKHPSSSSSSSSSVVEEKKVGEEGRRKTLPVLQDEGARKEAAERKALEEEKKAAAEDAMRKRAAAATATAVEEDRRKEEEAKRMVALEEKRKGSSVLEVEKRKALVEEEGRRALEKRAAIEEEGSRKATTLEESRRRMAVMEEEKGRKNSSSSSDEGKRRAMMEEEKRRSAMVLLEEERRKALLSLEEVRKEERRKVALAEEGRRASSAVVEGKGAPVAEEERNKVVEEEAKKLLAIDEVRRKEEEGRRNSVVVEGKGGAASSLEEMKKKAMEEERRRAWGEEGKRSSAASGESREGRGTPVEELRKKVAVGVEARDDNTTTVRRKNSLGEERKPGVEDEGGGRRNSLLVVEGKRTAPLEQFNKKKPLFFEEERKGDVAMRAAPCAEVKEEEEKKPSDEWKKSSMSLASSTSEETKPPAAAEERRATPLVEFKEVRRKPLEEFKEERKRPMVAFGDEMRLPAGGSSRSVDVIVGTLEEEEEKKKPAAIEVRKTPLEEFKEMRKRPVGVQEQLPTLPQPLPTPPLPIPPTPPVEKKSTIMEGFREHHHRKKPLLAFKEAWRKGPAGPNEGGGGGGGGGAASFRASANGLVVDVGGVVDEARERAVAVDALASLLRMNVGENGTPSREQAAKPMEIPPSPIACMPPKKRFLMNGFKKEEAALPILKVQQQLPPPPALPTRKRKKPRAATDSGADEWREEDEKEDDDYEEERNAAGGDPMSTNSKSMRLLQVLVDAARPLKRQEILTAMGEKKSANTYVDSLLRQFRNKNVIQTSGGGGVTDPFLYFIPDITSPAVTAAMAAAASAPAPRTKKGKRRSNNGSLITASSPSTDNLNLTPTYRVWKDRILECLKERCRPMKATDFVKALKVEKKSVPVITMTLKCLRENDILKTRGRGGPASPYVYLPPGWTGSISKGDDSSEDEAVLSENEAEAEEDRSYGVDDDFHDDSLDLKPRFDDHNIHHHLSSPLFSPSHQHRIIHSPGSSPDRFTPPSSPYVPSPSASASKAPISASDDDIEEILSKRISLSAVDMEDESVEYLVRWKNSGGVSWVPALHLHCECQGLLSSFEQALVVEEVSGSDSEDGFAIDGIEQSEDWYTQESDAIINQSQLPPGSSKAVSDRDYGLFDSDLRSKSNALFQRIEEYRKKSTARSLTVDVDRLAVLSSIIRECERWTPSMLMAPFFVIFRGDPQPPSLSSESKDLSSELHRLFWEQALSNLFTDDHFLPLPSTTPSARYAIGLMLLKGIIDRYPLPPQLCPLVTSIISMPDGDPIRRGFFTLDIYNPLRDLGIDGIDRVLCGQPATASQVWKCLQFDRSWTNWPRAVVALKRAVLSLSNSDASRFLLFVSGVSRLPYAKPLKPTTVYPSPSLKGFRILSATGQMLAPCSSSESTLSRKLSNALADPNGCRL